MSQMQEDNKTYFLCLTHETDEARVATTFLGYIFIRSMSM